MKKDRIDKSFREKLQALSQLILESDNEKLKDALRDFLQTLNKYILYVSGLQKSSHEIFENLLKTLTQPSGGRVK